MKTWSDSLAECQRNGSPHVLVTVISTGGSTPRAAGTKMLVLLDDVIATIGGGQVEFQAVQQARDLLRDPAKNHENQQVIRQVLLGADAGQCCGGYATLLFESFPARQAELWVFGAGHVAKALMQILQQLPVSTRWIDNRPDMFPAAGTLAAHIECVFAETPEDLLAQAPQDSRVLILTHDHALDYRLAETALKLGRFASIGVIGSANKAARFRHRLLDSGISEAQLASMQCPVGLAEVGGKLPMEVAVSIAGQLIHQYQSAQPRPARSTGVPLPTLKALMKQDKQAQLSAQANSQTRTQNTDAPNPDNSALTQVSPS
ncbi:xanthine dehydrogenase accessory protein XdhC [Parathalassolituus penaei]|uniref:Xanthine dehydrogenase accessory protein XdhC n=1 Tax=Parathalassolituus penaei TaxID=2997323 RepID=A0A9X3EAJ3_9GAMM|nr:xanthine dehydrogenase accessory protein XdhC [Parathalassolituus penaei]MCY0963977.1 xanthine dehydrogenase accessory protein XdhC [Parathalassolituus penaei]